MAERLDAVPELERMAEAVGLHKLMKLSPSAVEKAWAAAGRLKSELPTDFALSDEPAHVYRASPEA